MIIPIKLFCRSSNLMFFLQFTTFLTFPCSDNNNNNNNTKTKILTRSGRKIIYVRITFPIVYESGLIHKLKKKSYLWIFPPSLRVPIIGMVVLMTVLKLLINMIFSKHLLNCSLLSGSSIDDSRERQRVGERERKNEKERNTIQEGFHGQSNLCYVVTNIKHYFSVCQDKVYTVISMVCVTWHFPRTRNCTACIQFVT